MQDDTQGLAATPSPQFEHFSKLCQEFQFAMSSVLSKAGLSPSYYERLRDHGKIPPLERAGTKKDGPLDYQSIVKQFGIPKRKLEPAIRFGITAYMLQQIDQLGLDDEERGCFLSELRIRKGEWDKWTGGTEPVLPEILSAIAAYFAVPVDVFTSYTSLKKSIRDDIFRNYLKKRKRESLKSILQLALEMGEEAVIINHGGDIQILSSNSDEMEWAIKKISKLGLRDFAEFIETDEYKAEVEKRINLTETRPY